MNLKVLSLKDVERVRIWRNECLESLRTSFPLTEEMQADFHKNVICNRNTNSRFWGIWDETNKDIKYEDYIVFNGTVSYAKKDLPGFPVIENNPIGIYGYHVEQLKNAVDMLKKQSVLIGMVGIENIEIENRRGEISIILKPEMRGQGKGEEAIDLLLDKGFNYLNLDNIFGEVYQSNRAFAFWEKIIKKYNAYYTMKENIKYYNGKYWDGLWFNIKKENYKKA